MTRKKQINRTEAIENLRAIFSKIDAGEYGFFIQVVRETKASTYVRLFLVEDNTPCRFTQTVIDATGCSNRQGCIVLGDCGTDRFLGLMYYQIGFALYSDSKTALDWAHKYYRSVL